VQLARDSQDKLQFAERRRNTHKSGHLQQEG
jgi:hypothetical protein